MLRILHTGTFNLRYINSTRSMIKLFMFIYRKQHTSSLGEAKRATTILKRILNEKGLKSAEDFFQSLTKDHLSIHQFNLMIRAYIVDKKIQEAHTLLKKMVKMGIQPDNVTMNCIIEPLFDAKDINTGKIVMYNFIKQGVMPSEHTLAIIINGLSAVGKIQEAEKIFKEFSQNYNIPHTRYIIAAMLKMYISHGEHDKAVSMFKSSSSEQRDVSIYNMMMKYYLGLNNHQAVSDLLIEMEQQNHKPDGFTYATLIVSYNKLGHFEKTVQVYEDICARNLPINDYGRIGVLEAYCELDKMDKAIKIFEENNYITQSIPCTIILHKYIQNQDMYEIELILEKMQQHRTKFDQRLFNIIVHGYCKQNQLYSALKFVRNAKTQYDIEPDFSSYQCIIYHLLRDDQIEQVFYFLEELKEIGTPHLFGLINYIKGKYFRDSNNEEKQERVMAMLEHLVKS
jgi:pentatricopeptide repeat protein